MIITKLNQKYRLGCGRGISAVKEPGLHYMINSIIDWDLSNIEVPADKADNAEQKSLDDYFLEPGDCFCIGIDKDKARMVLALDKDNQIVCIVNDTGVLALNRILDEQIKPEFELAKGDYSGINEITWESKNMATDYPSVDMRELGISKNKYRLWRKRFEAGRGDIKFPEGFMIVSVTSDSTMGQTVKLYFDKYTIRVPEDGSLFLEIPGLLEEVANQTLSWMYNEIPVCKPPVPTPIKEEEIEEP